MAIAKFPVSLQERCAYNSTKQQSWDTAVQETASGRYRTMSNQLYPKWKISVLIQPLTDNDARILMGFVAARKGGYEPFLWLDAEDYKEKGIILPKVSNGIYQAVMKMGEYVEPVEYIENVKVYIDGVEQSASTYTVENGYITFVTAPATGVVVTADYTYYWKVRFDDDGMGINHIFDNINRSERFKLVTVR